MYNTHLHAGCSAYRHTTSHTSRVLRLIPPPPRPDPLPPLPPLRPRDGALVCVGGGGVMESREGEGQEWLRVEEEEEEEEEVGEDGESDMCACGER